MKAFTKPLMLTTLCGLLALPSGGCAILADALDPNLAVMLGLDPATISPQRGTIIVAFDNTTRFAAEFFAFESVEPEPADYVVDSRNFSVQVPAGQVRNEVLSCPVGAISPGSLDASFAPQTLAVQVTTDTEVTDVEYTGQALQAGTAYSCGDVIEIRLVATGTATAQTYSISVRIIPGE